VIISHELYWYGFTLVGEDKYLLLHVLYVLNIILIEYTSTLSLVDALVSFLMEVDDSRSYTKDHNQYIMYVCVWDTYNETNSRKRRREKKKGKWMKDKYIIRTPVELVIRDGKINKSGDGGRWTIPHYRVRIFYAVRDGFRSHVNRFVIFTTTRRR